MNFWFDYWTFGKIMTVIKIEAYPMRNFADIGKAPARSEELEGG